MEVDKVARHMNGDQLPVPLTVVLVATHKAIDEVGAHRYRIALAYQHMTRRKRAHWTCRLLQGSEIRVCQLIAAATEKKLIERH
ncbi:hypothetical protein SBA_ch1_30810 [Sphingomonas bisphenolicum]|uniref:Uncharacterized protein n=1 Tax=Sphingomonas bisphenolicum TaxID=296544 RepID=A0ABN5WF30_9SPHN|nr:hypothetical protein SBA_ch1_30810 [Sphingomonas bisphenolicum]